MTPSLQLKHRMTHWLRTTDAWELGRQVALTCLDPDDVRFTDEDEHEAFWKGWNATKAAMLAAEAALDAGRLAEAEDELDSQEPQPTGWWAGMLWLMGVRP